MKNKENAAQNLEWYKNQSLETQISVVGTVSIFNITLPAAARKINKSKTIAEPL